MIRRPLIPPVLAGLALMLLAGSAWSQTAGGSVLQTAPDVISHDPQPAPSPPAEVKPSSIEVTAAPLASPDLFFPGGPGLALDEGLWTGTPGALLQSLLPRLAPMPGEAGLNRLAVRLLATGAKAPEGAQKDADLAGQRALALIRFGALDAAEAILARTPGVSDHARLSEAKAEAALFRGDIDGACQTADSLSEGKDRPYWLRLRGFCLARAGKASEAQLTLDLAASGPGGTSPLSLVLNAFAAGVAATGPGPADNALGLRLSLMEKLDLSAAIQTAGAPALQVLAAEASLAPDLRRRAAYRLIAFGPDASGAAAAALALAVPDVPPPAPRPAPPRRGKHARPAAPPPALPSDPAENLARALQAVHAAADLSVRAVALAEFVRTTAPDHLVGASSLVADAVTGLSTEGLAPDAARAVALVQAAALGKAPLGLDSAEARLFRLALKGLEPTSGEGKAGLVPSAPARQTTLWLTALSALKSDAKGGAGLIAAASASQGGRTLEPGDRALAIRLLSLSGWKDFAEAAALDGMVRAERK